MNIKINIVKNKLNKIFNWRIFMIDKLALILSIIGSLNWGSIGIFNFDIVGALFGGQDSILSRIIFIIVGISGIWCISLLFKKNSTLDQ